LNPCYTLVRLDGVRDEYLFYTISSVDLSTGDIQVETMNGGDHEDFDRGDGIEDRILALKGEVFPPVTNMTKDESNNTFDD